MLRIAVCEDDKTDLIQFQREIDNIKTEFPSKIIIDYYQNGEMLAKAAREHRYDLLLLDIYLDGMSGIETARTVRAFLPEIQIAFLTSSRDYALDAFGLNAVHYLLKPVDRDNIHELFRRVLSRSRQKEEYLEIQSDKKTYSFPLSQVQKMQSHNKGVDIYLHNISKPQRIPLSLIRVEEQLNPEYFLKISRGLIVHMSYILCIDKNTCIFRDGTSSLISRGEKLSVRRKYNDYLFSHSRKEEFL